jgi:predicted nucleotidyltransferase
MDEKTLKSPLERIAAVLLTHGVEFLVIGGQAENLYGSPRVTYDVDLCYRRTPENLERLAAALRELRPTLRDAPPDLPFRIDAQSLALGSNFTFTTDLGDLDLLGYVEPIGGWDELSTDARTMHLDDLALRIISLGDLIRIKEYLGRPKDRDSARQLRALHGLQEDAGRKDMPPPA